MSLRQKTAMIMGSIIILATGLFSFLIYRAQTTSLIDGIDRSLYTAAIMAKEILPADYHDNIVNAQSVTEDEYIRIVDRWDRLCVTLNLEYLWSLMNINGDIVFTSGSATSKDVTQGDYASFFELHSNPELYETAFSTMEPQYQINDDKWGRIRAVLLPFKDSHGRAYLFGASMKTETVDSIIRVTLWKSLGIGGLIFVFGIFFVVIFTGSITRPIVRLINMAEKVAAGDEIDVNAEEMSGIRELNSLHHSIHTMYLEIQDQMTALQKSREDLRITLNSIGDAVIATDIKGCVTKMNPVAEELTGWRLADAVDKPLSEVFTIVNADTRESVENPIWKVLRTNKIVGLANHTVLISKQEKEYQIADSAAPIRDSEGNVAGVVLVFRDVTDEYAIRKALRESEEKHRLFVESFQGIAYQAEQDTFHPYLFEGTIEELTGFTAEDFINEKISWRDIIHPDDKKIIYDYGFWKQSGSQGLSIIEYRIYRKDDQIRWVRDVVMPCRIGDLDLVQGTVVDITDRKRAEEKLLRSLNDKDVLIREVHHRVKNNMQLIISLLDLQISQCEGDIRPIIEDITGRIRIFSDIHSSLYQFESVSRIDFADHLKRNFENLIRVFSSDPDNYELELDISAPFFDLNIAVPCGLLMNELMTNSMKHGFTSNGEISISINCDSSGRISDIRYSDDGIGLKKFSEGFGSVIIRTMAAQLGLTYTISRDVPLTYTFVRLDHEIEPEINSADILFVEDEVIIAMARISELKSAGYSVDENILTSGESALEYFRKHPEKIVLIIMDVSLKGEMDGITTALEIQKIKPELPVIFISGYEDVEIMEKISTVPHAQFLKKTCTMEELKEAIGPHLG